MKTIKKKQLECLKQLGLKTAKTKLYFEDIVKIFNINGFTCNILTNEANSIAIVITKANYTSPCLFGNTNCEVYDYMTTLYNTLKTMLETLPNEFIIEYK